MSRKPKSTSVIDGLPANQREALERWLFEENVSFADGCTRLYQDFSVRSSESALRRWYQRVYQTRTLDRIAASASKANAVMDRFAKNPASTYDALLGLIGQMAFEESLKAEKEISVETLSDLTNLVLSYQGGKLKAAAEARKERELSLKKEKLELELRKYQDVIVKVQREVSKAKGGGLSAEGLKSIEEAVGLL